MRTADSDQAGHTSQTVGFVIHIPNSKRHTCKIDVGSSESENEQRHEKTCFMSYADNKCAYQPVHLRSLISTLILAA